MKIITYNIFRRKWSCQPEKSLGRENTDAINNQVISGYFMCRGNGVLL